MLSVSQFGRAAFGIVLQHKKHLVPQRHFDDGLVFDGVAILAGGRGAVDRQRHVSDTAIKFMQHNGTTCVRRMDGF